MPTLSTPAAAVQSSASIVEQPITAPAPKRGDKISRGGTSAGRPGQIVTFANKWRENYNPLRGLKMADAVSRLEMGERGDTALLQWTYRFVEMSYATLSGLISRCEAPLAQFDWHIKTKAVAPPDMAEEAFKAMAEKQKHTLEDAYNSIDNLRQAILHLHRADFRGYAHLQKHRDEAGDTIHLEPLNQWCVCRDGLEGNWFWNPDSRFTSAPMEFLGKANCIGGDELPLEDFIIRECERPIDRVGLINFLRSNLCEKDWDGFIEIYGIPGGVVIMPSNVPQGQEGTYETAAKQVAEGAAGALPAGSDYKANDQPRGTDPFTPRIKHLDESLILAGTGGKLTMMTEAASGTRGNSKVHDKTFGEIADGRARSISEIFQRAFDEEELNRKHAGEPHLVYFDFGAEEEEDLNSLCANVLSLSQAGKNTNTEWLSEKTGYELEDAPEPDQDDPNPGGQPKAGDRPKAKVENRAGDNSQLQAQGKRLLIEALLAEFEDINRRLDAASESTDAEEQKQKLAELMAELDDFKSKLDEDKKIQQAFYKILVAGTASGMAEHAKENE